MNKCFLVYLILLISILKADLLTPENESILSRIHVLFDWEQEPNAIEYNLQISNTITFNEILLDTNIYDLIYIDKAHLDWEKEYFWRVKPLLEYEQFDNWINTKSFSISNSISNETNNFEVEIYDENLIENQITLFGCWYDENSIAFDKYGREIWNSGNTKNFIVNVDKYSRLYGFKYPDNPNDGYYGNIVQMKSNFDNVILNSSDQNETRFNRHECKELENGNFLVLDNTATLGPIPLGNWTENFRNLGYEADGQTLEINWRSQDIVELNKFGEEIWRWKFSDYFSKEEYDMYGGTWEYTLQSGSYDWSHSNSIWFDSNNDVIYLSIRHLSKILKIDYPSGDIIWQIGLPMDMGVGNNNICTELGFSWQHDVKILDNENLLLFDNGNISHIINNTNQSERISRILEVKILENNECELINEYELPYYSSSMGSVQLLENNNYLINSRNGEYPSIFEINSDQNIIWSTLLGGVTNNNYRAFRVPSIYPNAYTVIIDSLKNINLEGTSHPGIVLDGNYFHLKIYNKSNIKQDYEYILSDIKGWINTISDIVTIEANDSTTLIFEVEQNNFGLDGFTQANFNIKPTYHQYSEKNINFYVSKLINTDINNFNIIQIFPNPFNGKTEIIFDIPYESHIQLSLYNLNGQQIEKLVNKEFSKGRFLLEWNAEKYSSGLYFVKMTTNNFTKTKKITLLK